MKYIDVQCFAGGFTLGATQAGMTLVHKAEEPAGFGMPLCEANRHLLGDAWQGQADEPENWAVPAGGADVLIANPPCSGFSVMTPKSFRGIDSPINSCMRNTFAYAARVKPAAVIMESVGSAYAIGLPLMRELAASLVEETGRKYYTTHVLQNNLALGGCSRRRRYFLVVSEAPLGVEREPIKWIPTLGDAISDLKDLPLSWHAQPYQSPPTWWSTKQRSARGLVDGHQVPVVSQKHLDRVEAIVGEGGVDWPPGLAFDEVMRLYYEKHGHLPEVWQYESTTKDPMLQGLTRDKILIEKNFNVGGYAQTRHWKWTEPAYVITGHGPTQVWHPNGRHITHRECARIMGFPDDWKIAPLSQDKNLTAYWGKGVSVDPGRWISTWVKNTLEGNPGSITGDALDAGDYVIDASGWWKDAPAPGFPPAPEVADEIEVTASGLGLLAQQVQARSQYRLSSVGLFALQALEQSTRPKSARKKSSSSSKKKRDPGQPYQRSAETREKIAAANRGKKHSPETIAKMKATAARKRAEALSAIGQGPLMPDS